MWCENGHPLASGTGPGSGAEGAFTAHPGLVGQEKHETTN